MIRYGKQSTVGYRRLILRRRSSGPVLLSLSHDLVDTAGGDQIVATGTGLAGATGAEVSRDGVAWVPAAVSGVTDSAVTVTMPALAAGEWRVRVVVAGETGEVKTNALRFEAIEGGAHVLTTDAGEHLTADDGLELLAG